MNHEVMNIFNPQASQQAFDQIKKEDLLKLYPQPGQNDKDDV